MSIYRDNLFYTAKGNMFEHARVLRQESTKPEEVLWKVLRNRQVQDCKFRRQHPIDVFIADFYCHEMRLAIEIDGEVHEVGDAPEYDKNRSYELKEWGITVIRFKNEEILNELDKVILAIEEYIVDFRAFQASPPNPLL